MIFVTCVHEFDDCYVHDFCDCCIHDFGDCCVHEFGACCVVFMIYLTDLCLLCCLHDISD